MRQSTVRRRLRELRNRHREFVAEEYQLTDSPDALQHFEDYYLQRNTPLWKVRSKLRGLRQFPRAWKEHILEHYKVKRQIRRLRRRTMRSEMTLRIVTPSVSRKRR